MPDFDARIEAGTATLTIVEWTDLTPSPSGEPRSRRNPRPGYPETFLKATGSVGATVEIRAVPMGNVGRHDGAENASSLADSSQDWVVDALIGSIVENLSDRYPGTEVYSSATITDNNETAIIGTLTGGPENKWDVGDQYRLRMADAALNGRLFTIDCIEHPTTPPRVTQAAGWSAEATIELLESGHYTFVVTRADGGGGLILHLDVEVS
jgi:hypothetical protein